MKKLAVVLMIPALVLLAAAMVVAQDTDWGAIYSIKGVYAVTGFSTCLPAGSSGIFEADYTFNGDGTGSVTDGFIRNLTPNGAKLATYTAYFQYEVTRDGRITFEYPYPPGGNYVVPRDLSGNALGYVLWDRGPGHGVISSDGKTITVTCGPPVVLTVLDSNLMSRGTQNYCVTTGVGVRVRSE